MAVGKASTSRKCRILLGLRSRILILKALSSSCHILLVFMKVVFIHFPWLRWARSEGPAPATEEFPAQQPLPITEFRWQKKAATATPIREFLTTASQHCGSNSRKLRKLRKRAFSGTNTHSNNWGIIQKVPKFLWLSLYVLITHCYPVQFSVCHVVDQYYLEQILIYILYKYLLCHSRFCLV